MSENIPKFSGPSEFLSLQFGPSEKIHQWRCMPECDEFVGARRSKHTVVSFKDAIYVFGGDNGKVMLNDLLRFDVKEKSWGRAYGNGCPPSPRYHHSAVVHDSSMFVFGGFSGDIQGNSNLKNQNDLFQYKFHTCQWIQWETGDNAPVPRSAHGAAVYDDKLWIFAGYDGNSRLNDMWTINLTGESHSWEKVKQLGVRPPTCCNFPVVVVRDSMYVFSGQSGAKFTNSLFCFQFKEKCWSQITYNHILRGGLPPPTRRYGHSVVTFGKCLYVFGGAADSALPNDLYCFDLDTETWSIIHPSVESETPSGRLFHASSVVGDCMYVFGGTVFNNVRSGDMYKFQLSNNPKCTLSDDFGKLLRSEVLVDVEFLLGDEQTKVLAHSVIVAARSRPLAEKITNAFSSLKNKKVPKSSHENSVEIDIPKNLKEENSLESENSDQFRSHSEPETSDYFRNHSSLLARVFLPHVDHVAFKVTLHYMYTDKIEPGYYKEKIEGKKLDPSQYKDKKESVDSKKFILLMMDVYFLAISFEIPRLVGLCVEFLESKVNIDNVLTIFCEANRLDLTTIRVYCMKFIVRDGNYNQVVMSFEFEKLEKSLMVEIIRKNQTMNSQLVRFEHVAPNYQTIERTLQKDMEYFMKGENNFCDFVLMLETDEVCCHKAILAARTSYFESMFRSFMPKENRVKLSIGDIVPTRHSVESLLKFIYYGDVNIPPQDAVYLFSASLFFGFANSRMQVFCKQSLETRLFSENLIVILEAADRVGALEFKNHVLGLIVKDFSKSVKVEQLQKLKKELLLDIINSMADNMKECKVRSSQSSHCSGFNSD